MKKSWCYILLILGFSQTSFSLNYQTQPKNQIQEYLIKSKHFLKEREKDSALFYVNKAIDLSKNKNNTEQEVASLDQKGKIYLSFKEFNHAAISFEKAINLPSSNTNCELYNNLGVAKYNLGREYECIRACLQAQECYEENNVDVKINSTLYILGWSYMYVEEYDMASHYFLKQLNSIKADTSQTLNKSRVYRALGINSSLKGDYKESLRYLDQALVISNSKDDGVTISENLNSISSTYLLMEDYDKAFEYSKEALSQASEINDEATILGAKMRNMSALIGLNNFNEASLIMNSVAKDTVKDFFYPRLKGKYYENAALIYAGLGDYSAALSEHKRFKQFNDSINSANNSVNIAELKEQYKIEKNQNTILTQKAKLSKQANKLKNNTIVILIVSFVAFIFAVVIGFSVYLKREKRKRIKLLTLQFQEGFNEYLKTKYKLTQQQLDLWLKIVKGIEEVEIAESFFKSVETINRWRRKLYAKLNSVEETEKHYTKSKAIILYNKELSLFKELSKQNNS